MDYPQDSRTVNMFGGFGPNGEALPVTRERMVEEVSGWPVRAHAGGGREPTGVARDLFVHCLLVWEFGAVGVAWSLMAVESCIRWALDAPDSASFKRLVGRAHREGLQSDELAETVDAGRRLRNNFSHPRNQPVLTIGTTAPALRTSHVVVHH